MKNKCKIIVIILLIMLLTGCSKYDKDESYDTDIFGTYSEYMEASNVSYSLNETYTFNIDYTYNHTYREVIDGTTNSDINIDGKILSIEEISNDITQIKLEHENTEWSTGESSNQTIYKYKNMIGIVFKAKVPNGKTFKLQLSDYVWFDEEGQYHLCNGDNCQCNGSSPKYIRKDNIIYFRSIDEDHSNCYTIGYYIIDGYLFLPELYKADNN